LVVALLLDPEAVLLFLRLQGGEEVRLFSGHVIL
jgi:hypothetical protein